MQRTKPSNAVFAAQALPNSTALKSYSQNVCRQPLSGPTCQGGAPQAVVDILFLRLASAMHSIFDARALGFLTWSFEDEPTCHARAQPECARLCQKRETDRLGSRHGRLVQTGRHSLVRWQRGGIQHAVPAAGGCRNFQKAQRSQASEQLSGPERPHRRGPCGRPHLHLLG